MTNSVDKTHKNLFTVDIPETSCNVTANAPANGNGNCTMYKQAVQRQKTTEKTVAKTRKNLFTVDIPETSCNVTAKLPANVNGNCTMHKQAVQQ